MSPYSVDQKKTGIKFESPFIGKWMWLKLIVPFILLLFKKEKVLPEKMLSDYLAIHMKKKDVLCESASRFGTPQYFYDQPELFANVRRFHKAFSRNVPKYKTFYALKSNCFSLILNDVVNMGMGLDTSSGRELKMALQTDSKKILFSGPGKTDEELIFALDNFNRVIILIDSFNELSRLSKLINPGQILNVGVRIRSNQNKQWSKFGIPLQELAIFADEVNKTKGIYLKGVQFHSSWNMEPSRQVSMIGDIGDFMVKNLPKNILENLEFIDIGGGFWPERGEWLNPRHLPVSRLTDIIGVELGFKSSHYYFPSVPIEYFAKSIGECLLCQPEPIRNLELFMEPGRWISNPAMHILLKVIDKKDANTVITDGGINLLGWERPLHEFIPVINLSHFQAKEQDLTIFGSLCAPEDKWGDSIFGEYTNPGDILLVPDQGAYTYSLRHSFIKPVAKVVKYNGDSLEQVEQQSN